MTKLFPFVERGRERFYNIAELHLPLTLGRRILQPRAKNQHNVILEKSGGASVILEYHGKVPLNMASLCVEEWMREHEAEQCYGRPWLW